MRIYLARDSSSVRAACVASLHLSCRSGRKLRVSDQGQKFQLQRLSSSPTSGKLVPIQPSVSQDRGEKYRSFCTVEILAREFEEIWKSIHCIGDWEGPSGDQLANKTCRQLKGLRSTVRRHLLQMPDARTTVIPALDSLIDLFEHGRAKWLALRPRKREARLDSLAVDLRNQFRELGDRVLEPNRARRWIKSVRGTLRAVDIPNDLWEVVLEELAPSLRNLIVEHLKADGRLSAEEQEAFLFFMLRADALEQEFDQQRRRFQHELSPDRATNDEERHANEEQQKNLNRHTEVIRRFFRKHDTARTKAGEVPRRESHRFKAGDM